MSVRPRLKPAAWWLMGLGGLLLLAGWVLPELWRPAFAEQRPLGFALVGSGALAMWFHARREAEQRSQEALATLTQSSLTPYEFAPVTMPMDDGSYGDATLPPPPEDGGDPGGLASAPDPAPTAASPTAASAPAQWTAGLLRTLEWRRFETLCEEILRQDGYVVKREARDSGRGDHLWLHSRLDLEQPVRMVQCQNWSGEPVGLAAVREFLGAMVDAGLKSGAFMSCGAFTDDAEALARRHGIMLISGPDLMTLIDKRPAGLQRELLTLATEGDPTRPTCRRCGSKMLTPATEAEPRPEGPTHWVCEAAPGCPGTLAWSPGPA